MDKLLLIGGGGHAKSCIDVIEKEAKFEIVGILDIENRIGETICGYNIIGTDADIPNYSKSGCFFLISIGQIQSADLRINLFNKVKNYGGNLATIISPFAYLAKGVRLGEGTIIHHNVLINSDASVGKNCIINSKSLIEHDCIIEDNCHISVGAVLAGGSRIGKESFIGANATIVNGKFLPQNSFVKAGALVK